MGAGAALQSAAHRSPVTGRSEVARPGRQAQQAEWATRLAALVGMGWDSNHETWMDRLMGMVKLMAVCMRRRRASHPLCAEGFPPLSPDHCILTNRRTRYPYGTAPLPSPQAVLSLRGNTLNIWVHRRGVDGAWMGQMDG